MCSLILLEKGTCTVNSLAAELENLYEYTVGDPTLSITKPEIESASC